MASNYQTSSKVLCFLKALQHGILPAILANTAIHASMDQIKTLK